VVIVAIVFFLSDFSPIHPLPLSGHTGHIHSFILGHNCLIHSLSVAATVRMPAELPISETRRRLHPLERLSSDFDYHTVARDHINPLISDLRETNSRFARSQLEEPLPISVASPRESFASLQKFLVDTDINRPSHPLMSHSNGPPAGVISSKTSLGREFRISGIFCPSNPSWFVTPDNQFEVESLVRLKGHSELPLWINRICGVGKDYVMFDVFDTRESVSSGDKITRLIAPFSPFYSLPFFQRLLFRHFHGLLKNRVEITGESKSVPDETSEMVHETSSDSGSSELFAHQNGSEMSWSGSQLTSASTIEAAGATATSSEEGENSESRMD
jgi:hypothetical protein